MPKKRATTRKKSGIERVVEEAQTAPVEEQSLNTVEEVIAEMDKLCDLVDAQLVNEATATGRRPERNFAPNYASTEPWKSFFDTRSMLTDRLAELQGEEIWRFEAADVVRPHLMRTAVGEVPSFARPGVFVMWIGSMIPIGCLWDGFIDPHGLAFAVDATRPFPNPEGASSGTPRAIQPEWTSPEDLFRWSFSQYAKAATTNKKNIKVPTFNPVPLNAEGRKVVQEMLEKFPALRDVVRRGPVRPVPMPAHVRSVQMSLMA
jgi:hypothetical protein